MSANRICSIDLFLNSRMSDKLDLNAVGAAELAALHFVAAEAMKAL